MTAYLSKQSLLLYYLIELHFSILFVVKVFKIFNTSVSCTGTKNKDCGLRVLEESLKGLLE